MRKNMRSVGRTILFLILLPVPELCLGANDGTAQFSLFIRTHIIDQALIAFSGIAAAAIFYYGIRMIVDSYNEKAFTDVTNSFMYVIMGLMVIALAGAFTNSFFNTISPGLLIPGINSIISFMIRAAEGVFTLMVVIAGLRMVTAQGDEGAFDKWKKVLIGNCVGAMIMLIANFIVISIATRDASVIVEELVGIGLFMLTIVGFASVLALIIGGILLIISIDESLRDRAKRAIIGTLISLVIVVATYSLIVTFVL